MGRKAIRTDAGDEMNEIKIHTFQNTKTGEWGCEVYASSGDNDLWKSTVSTDMLKYKAVIRTLDKMRNHLKDFESCDCGDGEGCYICVGTR